MPPTPGASRPRWPLCLALALLALACLSLALCGAGIFLLGRLDPASFGPGPGPAALDPTPAQAPVQRTTLPIEADTARALARATLPPRDLLDLGRRLQDKPAPPATPGVEATTAPGHALGDRETFWLHDVTRNTYHTTTAILRYETPHAYWWVAEGFDVADDLLARSARNFEQGTYPRNRSLFGSEPRPGIDGDPHVYLFLGDVPGVAGYFSSPDEYPVEIRPQSNQHEMIYLNLRDIVPGDDYFDGVLAHEFQHMIHWSVDRDEATWVNEGLSELAAALNGYDVGGSEGFFLQAPDTQLTTWPDLENSGPYYGASFLFLTYFHDLYGDEAVRQLVAEPANGIAGFDAVLARLDPGRSFEDLFAGWLVANYLDGLGVEEERYGYAGLDLDHPRLAAHHATYPVEQRAAVHQYAADYLLLEGDGDLVVEFTGSTSVSLAGNRTHGGDYQWCTVRGDEGDARLTRAFDLTGLRQASLQAWMWYDLELDYDYAYVEVSADGGHTWQILSTAQTTSDNPSGNSYGPGFTGVSGSPGGPEWVREVIDLSPFAGGPILVRFEVVTDDTVNHPGLCLDDLALPELGYQDGAEKGDGGWQAEGWVRVGDHVPQRFLVQVITLGQTVDVERLALDDRNRGSLTVAGLGRDVEGAVLVVSALAPSTTEPAVYTYRLSQP